ncbi:MAG TPA: hypothetical protein VLG28_11695 [Acidimicrobiia bacterium]|jgi:hypothetical protein|nr:hypothetical protein [Acidimicrobiia bacterium]
MRTENPTVRPLRRGPVARRIALVVVALTALTAAPAIADEADGPVRQRAAVVQEHNVDGTPNEELPEVGVARLTRRSGGLRAKAQVEGLIPGGVYTFWWVVVQEDGTFPDDIFVASGDGAVVGPNGRAVAYMSAKAGDASITGFAPDGVNELTFSDLNDTMGSLVRIEIAYHGQVEDAGDDLGTWLEDFWTGSGCPPDTPNPNPAQPHCPVWYAATFG